MFIVAHPSTARFISTKILQYLVTDEPTEAMLNQMVLVWDNPGNLHGVGDLTELYREALSMADFSNPTRIASKVKTPFEQFIGSIRSLKGVSDGVTQIINFLFESQHVPFMQEVPTGYAEVGKRNAQIGARDNKVSPSTVSGKAAPVDEMGDADRVMGVFGKSPLRRIAASSVTYRGIDLR